MEQTELFRRATEQLFAAGLASVYTKRHEENVPSARMMTKSGFTPVATFDDPQVRPSGTRRTTVCRRRSQDAPMATHSTPPPGANF